MSNNNNKFNISSISNQIKTASSFEAPFISRQIGMFANSPEKSQLERDLQARQMTLSMEQIRQTLNNTNNRR